MDGTSRGNEMNASLVDHSHCLRDLFSVPFCYFDLLLRGVPLPLNALYLLKYFNMNENEE